eukprot:18158-Heterococcus_DN1.PRE.1
MTRFTTPSAVWQLFLRTLLLLRHYSSAPLSLDANERSASGSWPNAAPAVVATRDSSASISTMRSSCVRAYMMMDVSPIESTCSTNTRLQQPSIQQGNWCQTLNWTFAHSTQTTLR